MYGIFYRERPDPQSHSMLTYSHTSTVPSPQELESPTSMFLSPAENKMINNSLSMYEYAVINICVPATIVCRQDHAKYVTESSARTFIIIICLLTTATSDIYRNLVNKIEILNNISTTAQYRYSGCLQSTFTEEDLRIQGGYECALNVYYLDDLGVQCGCGCVVWMWICSVDLAVQCGCGYAVWMWECSVDVGVQCGFGCAV